MTAPSNPAMAWPHSLGVLVITVVMVAKFLLNDASSSLLEVSAETNVSRLRSVLKMSVLWSPSAETACESLMTVSRAVSPSPRRFAAEVLTN